MSLPGNLDQGMETWDDVASQPQSQPSYSSPANAGSPEQPYPAFASVDVAVQALYQAVYALGQNANAFQTIQEQQSKMLEALTRRLEAQSHMAPPAPTPASAAPPAPAPVVHAPRPSAPKVREPRMFSGKAAEVVPFLREIRVATHLQRASFPTDYDKSLYLSMYLKDGSPMSWYNALELKQEMLLHDFEKLQDAFRKRFEDQDLVLKNLHKIEKLEQTGSAAAYANQFQELLNYLDWTDFMQITQFDRGLKAELKRVLVNTDRPDTLDEWIPTVVEADNRLHNLELEQKQKHPHKTQPPAARSDRTPRPQASPATPATSSSTPTPSGSADVVPMEIDAMRRGPVSAAEKERRRKEGLCFYCGQGKHLASDCPNMSEHAKKHRKAVPTKGKA